MSEHESAGAPLVRESEPRICYRCKQEIGDDQPMGWVFVDGVKLYDHAAAEDCVRSVVPVPIDSPTFFLHATDERVWCVRCKGWKATDGEDDPCPVGVELDDCPIQQDDESKWKPVTIEQAQQALDALAKELRELDEDVSESLELYRSEVDKTSTALSKGAYISDFSSISEHARAYVNILNRLPLCQTCVGSGTINSGEDAETCPDCKGSGLREAVPSDPNPDIEQLLAAFSVAAMRLVRSNADGLDEQFEQCRAAILDAFRLREAVPIAIDCRSPEGETITLIETAIVALRLVARANSERKPAINEALADLRADKEVQAVLREAVPCEPPAKLDANDVATLIRAGQPCWLDAASAPKDGSHILVSRVGQHGFGICGGSWQDWCAVVHYWPVASELGFYLSSGLSSDDNPVTFTHWMPLPVSSAPVSTTTPEPDFTALEEFLASRCEGHSGCRVPHEALDRLRALRSSSVSETTPAPTVRHVPDSDGGL